MTRHTWFEDVQRLKQSGQAFAMVTVLRAQAPTSAKPGDKALVTADGQIRGWIGGGCAQPSVIRTVRQALADGQSRVTYDPYDGAHYRNVIIRVQRWVHAHTPHHDLEFSGFYRAFHFG